jgi:hypothetical protein
VLVNCGIAMTVLGVGSAFAGEVTGNGKPTGAPAHANSICAFSGQNDGNPPPGRNAAHVQNWGAGAIPKEVRDVMRTQGFHPGDACNGHSGFLAGVAASSST